MKDTTTIK